MNEIGRKRNVISLEVASVASEVIVGALVDVCEEIQVVGSIRRKKPYVHDVDLVVIPRYEERDTHTLFSGTELTNLLDERLAELASASRISVKSNGDKMKRLQLRAEDVSVDIYVASRENWAALLLIRTGSRGHNIYLCSLAQRLGMQLKADGSGLFQNGVMIAGNSEESIFLGLGLNYVFPQDREVLTRR